MGLTSRDKRDAYYRLAKAHGYRARAAFKLIQMEDTLSLLKNATRVVDLCAAPGGWTQVVVERCAAAVVAVDLKDVAPVDGATILVGDLTSPLVIERIASTLDGAADVVLCDGAPDVLDLGDVDAHIQLSLCRAALACARKVLAQGGSFVCKIYRGRGAAAFFDELRREFADVLCAKPRCSRHASVEAYAVGRGFGRASDATGPVPFVACGGADAFDADASYALEEDYVYRDPVQAPLRPPHLVGVPTPPPASSTARRAAPAVAARPPRRREALACEGAPPPASDAGGLGAWFL